MNLRILIGLVIFTSFFGYLEWGGGNNSFLYQIEYDVLLDLFHDPLSVMHPFIVIPLLGQLLLLLAMFQKRPNPIIIYIGTGCLTILLGFMLFIGILSTNLKISLSTLPFLVTSFLTVREVRKKRVQ